VTLEFALLKLAQLRKLAPFGELLERVERLGGGPSAPRAAAAAAAPPAPVRRPAPEPPRPLPRPEPTPVPAAVSPAAASPADEILAALVALTDKRPSLREPLRGASARHDGEALVLELEKDYRALAELHVDEYRELLPKAAGRPLKLRLEARAGAAPVEAAAPRAAAEDKQRLLDTAKREKAVQEVLEMFNGKVVDVREA
jgi:hypothetical protein